MYLRIQPRLRSKAYQGRQGCRHREIPKSIPQIGQGAVRCSQKYKCQVDNDQVPDPRLYDCRNHSPPGYVLITTGSIKPTIQASFDSCVVICEGTP